MPALVNSEGILPILPCSKRLCASFVTMLSFNNGQDKWRNINVTAIWGSRQKARLAALKRNQLTPKHDANPLAVSTVVKTDEEIVDAKPLAVSGGALDTISSKERVKRYINSQPLMNEANF